MNSLPLAAVLLLFAGVAKAQTLGPVDWIFLVDTSKSMRGVGGTKDIFGDVKASLGSFVSEANDGDTVAIFTFDRGVEMHSTTVINATARDDLTTIVQSLRAEGDRTHLGAAIAKGLERAVSVRGDPTRSRAVVLFTDGREDVRGIANPIPIDANIARVADTFVFFVSMGDHEPQLDAFAAAAGDRTTVLKAPTAEAIREIATVIRKKIAPPPPPPMVWGKAAVTLAEGPKPSPLIQAAKALIALAMLAAIALISIAQQRKKNRLEGELEILRPRTEPDMAFIGLPRLQANEVALSSILPLDALAGSDARLFVKRKDGRKRVWITTQGGGPMRVNDVETPMSELYDADTIDIGEARLRFNRAGDDRPLESNQEGDL